MNSNNEKKFLVDAMLGNIAKKFRLMGFDTEYSGERSDQEIISMMQDQNRILITKDEELSKKVKKLGLESIFVTGDEELLNFKDIKQGINFEKFSIRGDTARCTICNGVLNAIEKESIKKELPKNVIENESNFWQCSKCKKIYWEGTHITHLQNFVRKINE